MSLTTNELQKTEPAIPSTFKDYLKAMGPGIIYIMGLFAVGDMTVAASAGSTFRYTALWGFTLGSIMLIALCAHLARYSMATGEGVFASYRRISLPLTYASTVALIFMPLNWHGYMWIAVGQASQSIFKLGGVSLSVQLLIFLFWALGLYPIWMRRYDLLEKISKVLLVILFVVVLFVFSYTRPNILEILSGAFVPRLSKELIPIILATFGATAAAIVCWNYSYFTMEKGWNSPKFERVMKFDLILSVVFMWIIDVLLVATSAEVLQVSGIAAKTTQDMAASLGKVIGTGGYLAYYLGMIAAAYSSIIAYSYVMSHMAIDSLGIPKDSERGKKLYKGISISLYTLPIAWSFVPQALGIVAFTVAVQIISNLFVLIPLAMLLIMGNVEKYAPKKEAFSFYRLRLWENIALVMFFCLIVFLLVRYMMLNVL
ncbi:MAG: NRAMP family divalent metal transporter [Bacillota bacterium]